MSPYEFIVKMKDYASSGLRNIAQSAGVADDRLDHLNKEAKRSESVFNSLKRAALTIFTTAAIVGFTNKVIDARSEYEKFRAVLANTFQSQDVGDSALALLTDFAAKTPFQLNELTGSYIKLVNRGIIPTRENLTNLGDLAASQGKGFDQLAEAVLDAGTGEFERLKEFGIKAAKHGDLVTLSFKGVNKEVANNATAIQNAINEYGKMPGVAGAMESISGTLGGKISNLKDIWNQFLVAVGGEGNNVLTGFVDMAMIGIGFLTDHLPQISMWFSILYDSIAPIVTSLWQFVKAAFGIGDTSDVLSVFAGLMQGILTVVGYVSTGIIVLIDFLRPFAPIILTVAAAWTVWNYALAVFNALMLVSPTTWIIIGIVALIAVIGMVTKYTEGWGKSWEALKTIFKLVWEQLKADFNHGVATFKFGFNLIILSGENAAQKIIGRFSKVGEAIKMALNGDFSGAWDKAFETVNTRAEAEMKNAVSKQKVLNDEYIKGRTQRSKELNDQLGNVGITVDTEGISKDWKALKDKFSLETGNPTRILDDVTGTGTDTGTGGTGTGKDKAESIVSGGTKHTNINITIQKLQDDTKIYVASKEEGLSQLGDKVQEMLLRAVNSVNQMQTA